MQYDIVCFSHLRWNFVFQRPQHLMTRMAAAHRVYYIEEPVPDAVDISFFESYRDPQADVIVITPHYAPGLGEQEQRKQQRIVLDSILRFYSISRYIIWHYSPMSYAFTKDLHPLCRVYDCMDELSNFLYAPPELKDNEAALLREADIVFTGGNSLFEAKKRYHSNIYAFPSSIDKQHFSRARELRASATEEPQDQRQIGHPRIGFFGVIDERMNIDMLRELSDRQPFWQFILIGPVVKIDPAALPKRDNIHYLGPKAYKDLPAYLAGWDIAMMPFALNASTEFISPTKTPEYLAGGVPVIAPSIRDVVTPYGELGLVSIADTADEFIRAAQVIMHEDMPPQWLDDVDSFLLRMSWDSTVADMTRLIEECIKVSSISEPQNLKSYV